MSGVQFTVHQDVNLPNVYFTRLTANIPPVEVIASAANQTHAINEAAQIALRRLGFQVDKLDHPTMYSNSKYLLRLLSFYYTDSERQSLIVEVQHGLSNRLRALASAAAVAAELKLSLKVIWLPDHHCRARFSDLFRIPYEANITVPGDGQNIARVLHKLRPQTVWEDESFPPAPRLLDPLRVVRYNYMEQEPGGIKDAPILTPKSDRSIYVKTAYRLNSNAGLNDANLCQALSTLVLSDAVLARLNLTVPVDEDGTEVAVTVQTAQQSLPGLGSMIGVHIRHQPPAQEIVTDNIKQTDYTLAAWQALAEARNLTNLDAYDGFIREALQADPAQKFYVSTDTPAIIDEMERRYGDSAVEYLPGQGCLNRSVECVQHALADQLLLGATKRILGSVWSSFSEMAGLWRMTPVVLPAEVNVRVEDMVQVLKVPAGGVTAANAAAAAAAAAAFAAGREAFKRAFIRPDVLAAGADSEGVRKRALPPIARSADCVLHSLSLLGERCSGTSYLQRLLEANFNLTMTHDFHYKHFFGFEDPAHPLSSSHCTLFVGVVRHPIEWLDSFYKYQWQLDQWRYPSWSDFLTQPIISYVESEMNLTLAKLPAKERAAERQQKLQQELWHDRNFADPKVPHWKNIFELRSTKLRYMMDAFPDKVDHYVLIRLEDLRAHYKAFLGIVQQWFNVQPRIGGGGALGSFVDAQLDDDLVNDQAELHGHAHQHVSDAIVDYAWQHLDTKLEDALGYRRSAGS